MIPLSRSSVHRARSVLNSQPEKTKSGSRQISSDYWTCMAIVVYVQAFRLEVKSPTADRPGWGTTSTPAKHIYDLSHHVDDAVPGQAGLLETD